MCAKNKFIKRETISDLLYGDEEYISDFTHATKDSYGEFVEKYRKHLLNEDKKNLRKAGHKIKPVSQMLNLSSIIEEYEYAKKLLDDDSTTEEQLEASARRMEEMIEQIKVELERIE